MTSLYRSKRRVVTAIVLVLTLLPLSAGASVAQRRAVPSESGGLLQPPVVRIDPAGCLQDSGQTFGMQVRVDNALDLGGFEL